MHVMMELTGPLVLWRIHNTHNPLCGLLESLSCFWLFVEQGASWKKAGPNTLIKERQEDGTASFLALSMMQVGIGRWDRRIE
jgi:hypothetical protein